MAGGGEGLRTLRGREGQLGAGGGRGEGAMGAFVLSSLMVADKPTVLMLNDALPVFGAAKRN